LDGTALPDFRIGIDVMTTETTCLSSIWTTDEKIEEFYEIHGRKEEYKECIDVAWMERHCDHRFDLT